MFGQTYGTYNGSTQTASSTNAYSTSLNEYNQCGSPSILNSVYSTNQPENLFNCYRMEPKNAMMKQANGEGENSSFEHLLKNRSNALGFGYPFGNAANCYLSAAAVAAAAAAAASQNNSTNPTSTVTSSDSTHSTSNYNTFGTNAPQMQHSNYGNQSMMNNESQLSLTPTSSSSSQGIGTILEALSTSTLPL